MAKRGNTQVRGDEGQLETELEVAKTITEPVSQTQEVVRRKTYLPEDT